MPTPAPAAKRSLADFRRRRNPAATREAIVTAAARLFLAKGFAAVAMSEIAKEAKVTKSLIHHHFGSKQGLWAAVKEVSCGNLFTGALETLQRQPGNLDLVRWLMNAHFYFYRRNPGMVRLSALLMLEGDREALHEQTALAELGAQRIREAQERGDIRPDVDPKYIMSMIQLLAQQWFLLNGTTDQSEAGKALEEAWIETARKVLFGGLLPRARPSSSSTAIPLPMPMPIPAG